MQTVNEFLNQPLPTILPIDSVHPIQPLSSMRVNGTPYPQATTTAPPTWSRTIMTPFYALFNRSRNAQP